MQNRSPSEEMKDNIIFCFAELNYKNVIILK